jgi:GNAT superfamily N-acetyltransferase
MRYYKRFRMEVDLRQVPPDPPRLPHDYVWIAWDATDLARHALAKFHAFREELDAEVFPCLGEFAGCQRLMDEICHKPGFLPQATWLICHQPNGRFSADCGTIQGIDHGGGLGAIQNVGITPEHRGVGLGRTLILKSLAGFRAAGVERVYLDVTALNWQAVQLYRSIGFRLTKTSYKAVESELVTP